MVCFRHISATEHRSWWEIIRISIVQENHFTACTPVGRSLRTINFEQLFKRECDGLGQCLNFRSQRAIFQRLHLTTKRAHDVSARCVKYLATLSVQHFVIVRFWILIQCHKKLSKIPDRPSSAFNQQLIIREWGYTNHFNSEIAMEQSGFKRSDWNTAMMLRARMQQQIRKMNFGNFAGLFVN